MNSVSITFKMQKYLPKIDFKKHKTLISVLVILITVLIAARLYLPYWVKDYVNKEINQLDGYSGHVEDIDFSLYRGAYQIQNIEIIKDDLSLDKAFFKASNLDISVEWTALFWGRFVVEIDFYDATFNFAKTQTGEGAGWLELVNSLTFFEINRLEGHRGKITYTDYTADPNIYLYLDDIETKITNIRQVKTDDKALPTYAYIKAKTIGDGDFTFEGNLNALQEMPDFDFSLSVENAHLPAFNNYINDVVALDFKDGTASLYMEIAAADGKVNGYIKPIAEDMNMVSLDQDWNPINLIWESLNSTFMEIFKNHEEGRFALRIPIEGDLKQPDQNFWSAFLSIFENAFGDAFSKDVDNTVSFRDLLFGNDKSENK